MGDGGLDLTCQRLSPFGGSATELGPAYDRNARLRADLVEALAEQERSGQRLGEILVARGLVSAGAVANALAEQHGGLLED